MSILGNLFSRILGHKASAAAASPPPSATAPAKPTAAPPGASAVPPVPNTGGAPASAAPRVARMDDVELEPLLDALVKTNGQKLDWRHSIVDLMKAVGMESSLAERKELAKELGYTGDMGDSAKMNLWLHREVLNQIAANGGKVPAALKD